MNEQAKGRVVAVTGAADGIGRAIASHYAHRGAQVAMFDVDESRLQRSAEELRGDGCTVLPVPMDVSDSESVEAGFATLGQHFGSPKICVSNVGVAGGTPVLEMSDREWRRVLSVNLDGTFYVTRAAALRMVDAGDGGKIVCLTSLAARSARMGAAHYCASKAGLENYVRALSMELAAHRINVNLVSPGFVDHGYREGLGQWVKPEYSAAIARTIPWGRTATVDDVVPAIEFLCSDAAQYITGTRIDTDGGGSAGRFSLPVDAS